MDCWQNYLCKPNQKHFYFSKFCMKLKEKPKTITIIMYMYVSTFVQFIFPLLEFRSLRYYYWCCTNHSLRISHYDIIITISRWDNSVYNIFLLINSKLFFEHFQSFETPYRLSLCVYTQIKAYHKYQQYPWHGL